MICIQRIYYSRGCIFLLMIPCMKLLRYFLNSNDKRCCRVVIISYELVGIIQIQECSDISLSMARWFSSFQVKRVYLDGIPRAWREEHVKKHLKEFGRIVKVELARHIPSAIRTNYCYVTFETHEAAATCVNGVNVDGLYFRDKRVRQLLFTVFNVCYIAWFSRWSVMSLLFPFKQDIMFISGLISEGE